MRQQNNKQGGFTLIEIIVVIVIISILAAILTPTVAKTIDQSRISRFANEYKSVKDAMLKYFVDVGEFMPCSGCGGSGISSTAWGSDHGLENANLVLTRHRPSWKGPYLDVWPKTSPWGYTAVGCGATNVFYQHTQASYFDKDGIGSNDASVHTNADCIPFPVPTANDGVNKILDSGSGTNNGSIFQAHGGGKHGYYFVGEGPDGA